MKGTIRERKKADGSTSYYCQILVGRDPDTGKRQYLSGMAKSERQAHKLIHKFVEQLNAGKATVQANVTLNKLIKEWLAKGGPAGEGTRYVYSGYIKNYIEQDIGKFRLRQLRIEDMDNWYVRLRNRGLSPSSIRKAHNIVRGALTQGVKWGWIPTNVAALASPPKVPKVAISTPEPKDVGKMIQKVASLKSPFEVYLRVAAVTGARPGELCALQWNAVRNGANEISIERRIIRTEVGLMLEDLTKTGKPRTIPIDKTTLKLLKEHRKDHEQRASECGVGISNSSFVFSDAPDGSVFWRPDSTSRKFRDFRSFGELDEAPLYGLRHQAATTMIDMGVDVKTVSERLGNSVATVLGTYTRARTKADRAAGDLMGSVFDELPAEKKVRPRKRQ